MRLTGQLVSCRLRLFRSSLALTQRDTAVSCTTSRKDSRDSTWGPRTELQAWKSPPSTQPVPSSRRSTISQRELFLCNRRGTKSKKNLRFVQLRDIPSNSPTSPSYDGVDVFQPHLPRHARNDRRDCDPLDPLASTLRSRLDGHVCGANDRMPF